MALYAALLYYGQDAYWLDQAEMEHAPEYGVFAQAATAAGVLGANEALHPPGDGDDDHRRGRQGR